MLLEYLDVHMHSESHSVVSDSLRPHGLQSTTLLRPWDFPGKGTGVGCHFRLQRIFPTQGSNPGLPRCRQMLYHLSHQGSLLLSYNYTICDPMDFSLTRFLHPWDFPGKNTGVGSHFLLHGIFPTQGLNPGLPHCRQTLYRLNHQTVAEPPGKIQLHSEYSRENIKIAMTFSGYIPYI